MVLWAAPLAPGSRSLRRIKKLRAAAFAALRCEAEFGRDRGIAEADACTPCYYNGAGRMALGIRHLIRPTSRLPAGTYGAIACERSS